MLKLFRKKIVMKTILWGLVVIVVPAFVMWGGASSSRSKGSGPGYVGFVENRKVLFDELSNAISGVRCQIILNYFNQPKALDALLSNKPVLAKIAWGRILMMEEVKKAGIKISDKEVVETLRSHPLFLRNGVFDDRFYAYMLRNNIGLEPRAFEEIVRENVSLQKLSDSLTKDIKLSDQEIADEYNTEFQRIKICYVMLEPKDFTDSIFIDDAAAKELYEKNRSSFVVKSKLKGALPDRPATFEEAKPEIIAYLKAAEASKTIKEKSGEVHKQILERMEKNGETFEKASAKMGLDSKETDFFSMTDNVEALGSMYAIAEAASKLKEFELSEPTQTDKGYLIFEIVDKKPADEEAFKKDKEEYSKKVRARRVNIFMDGWLKKLEEKAKLVINLEDTDKELR